MILSKIEDRFDAAPAAEGEKKKNLAQKIDFSVFPGIQGGPLDHVIAAKAVAFKEALAPEFVFYQKQVIKNAQTLAAALIENGITVLTGGTDNHLVLVDLTNTGLAGKEAEKLLDSVGIYTNKNMIPYDPRSPFDPSGLRIGTPALTTRGFKEDEMKVVGGLIARALRNRDSASALDEVRAVVSELTAAHPIYPELGAWT